MIPAPRSPANPEEPGRTSRTRNESGSHRFEVFYDGDCPLCTREIQMLSRRDRSGRIRFTDIARDDFDPSELGLSHETLMARIHGRTASGELVSGVEVFRQLYAAVGFGHLVAVSRWPGVRHLLDLAYDTFAKNRLRLTGRCRDGACELHAPRAPSRSARVS